jgi:hypothetical protein
MPTEDADSEVKGDRPEGEAIGPGAGPPLYDQWELDERLRHIERLLRIDPGSEIGPGREPHLRLDAAHRGAPGRHSPRTAEGTSGHNRAAKASAPESWLAALTWTVLTLGLMALTCGGVLLGWSLVAGREDLWTVGVPVALGGQIVLLIGLILQLDRLWHDNRHTAEKLHQVAHSAGGTSPQLLLADLKSQLDLLAIHLRHAER